MLCGDRIRTCDYQPNQDLLALLSWHPVVLPLDHTTTKIALSGLSDFISCASFLTANAIICCGKYSRRSNLRVTNGSLCHYYG